MQLRRIYPDRLLVLLATLATLGSGLLNLYSVMGPVLPYRHRVLRDIFPLEFLHFSRSLTLLTGFVLVVASVNLYRRKRRAHQLVAALAAGSIILHLIKGLDYEEATFSAIVLVILWFTRDEFTVRSGIPDVRTALLRFAVALGLVVAYGVAGFWFLDPREFGINFTIADSVRRTFRFLSFQGDPLIVPRTLYAKWFVESLYLAAGAGVLLAGAAIFRPVRYLLRTHPQELRAASGIVKKHGRSTLDFFKLWPDKSYYFSADRSCFVAYRVAGGFALVLGDPVGPENSVGPALEGFMAMCRDNGWGMALYQTRPDFLPLYEQLGLRKLKIGEDAIVDLTAFTLQGKEAGKWRTVINKIEKAGVHIEKFDAPLSDVVLARLREVSDDWLSLPGRRERGFTLGQFEPSYLRTTPVVAAVGEHGSILAFVNRLPAASKHQVTIDLMRRRTEAPNGIMDYLFVKLFESLKDEGFETFSLGMAPLSDFVEEEDPTPEERAVNLFMRHLNFLFSFEGLRHYKAKFASYWEPRYVIYRSPLDLPRVGLTLQRLSELE